MIYIHLVGVLFVFLFFAVPLDVSAKELPPLSEGQMSYKEAARLAKGYNTAVKNQSENKPISKDDMTDAMVFIGWTKGFAEATVMAERGKESQEITECLEKTGYNVASSAIASMFSLKDDGKSRPKNSDAQSYAYAGLVVYCKFQLIK